MKYEEIKNLLDNGFTKEEIMHIIDKEDTPAADPAEHGDEAPKVEPQAGGSGDPTPQDPSAAFSDALEKFGAKMDDVLKEIQAANIMASSQKGSGEDKTAEDILAQVILPPASKK